MTQTLPLWATVPATLLLVAGGLLALIASLGLLRLPDFYARMHPPTMITTLGAGCVLIASMLVSSALSGRPLVRELLLSLFVVITTPVTSMLLVRAAVYRAQPRLLAQDARPATDAGGDGQS
jgi:multicomponent K+:H+ antiporter subunit G